MKQWILNTELQAVQDSDPWGKETNEVNLTIARAYCLGGISRPHHRKEEAGRNGASRSRAEPGWASCASTEAREPGPCSRAEHQRGESSAESQSSAKNSPASSAEYWWAHTCEDSAQGQGTVPQSSHRLEAVLVPINLRETSCSQDRKQSIQRVLPHSQNLS